MRGESPPKASISGQDPGSSKAWISMGQTSVWRGLPGLPESVFEILPAGGPTGIARQKTEDKNSYKEEDDRVNGDL